MKRKKVITIWWPFLGFTIVSLVGSLMYKFPNVIWNNPLTLLHLKDKTYNYQLNRFLGKRLFFLACVSIVMLVVSLISPFVVSSVSLMMGYLSYLVVISLIFEFKWRKMVISR
ncbi:hypothetical protein I6N95_12370 [Vagococcus sp. BWB3-3]|uniref:Uncharacterized protein n=1 Tax=Vagococcus allomyrinae TaxID=2794353 RepID=A0A940SUZ4_9ENTE|nr:hypothetical protein [Vagococcus allomyrinae]MBP1041805.1 hypothetical protein [Vagococcus allomyrinae]